MRVLILNRRDIKNPSGGGAEVYTHEAAKGLLERGAEVEVFSSRFNNAPSEETIDGIRHIRRGNELTVHLRGFLYALLNRKRFDLIIDEFNGIGFFTFLFPQSVLLIHQLYREFWLRALGPFGYIPYFFEPLLLKLYRKKKAITVSDSTKKDLEDLGFKDVHIVMNALSNPALEETPQKEDAPTLLFLGRLKSTKKPEDAIEIFRLVKSKIPDCRLWIIGAGPEETSLKERAADLPDVTFFGWLNSERKFELLKKAHLLLVPGVREGFGIIVIEAASQGTPSVGYNIPGLRDSIRDGETGMLANGPDDAAEKALLLLKNRDLYAKYSTNCLKYAQGFNWKNRAEEFYQVITAGRN